MKVSIVVFSFSGHQHLLPYCLESIRDNAPEHDDIILVWDDNVDWYPIDFDELRQKTKVDFRLIKHSSIAPWPDSIIRWGWIKQQLAKLACWKYSTNQWNWIIDGDVLITGDPVLFDQQGPILRYDADRPVPQDYEFFMSRYLGIQHYHSHTFVGSSCLFDGHQCQSLDLRCRDHTRGLDLVAAVDHMLTNDTHPTLPFSEFECYGHHVWSQGSANLMPRNWNYVTHQSDWSKPIQVAWSQDPGQDLATRYHRLIDHLDPEVDH